MLRCRFLTSLQAEMRGNMWVSGKRSKSHRDELVRKCVRSRKQVCTARVKILRLKFKWLANLTSLTFLPLRQLPVNYRLESSSISCCLIRSSTPIYPCLHRVHDACSVIYRLSHQYTHLPPLSIFQLTFQGHALSVNVHQSALGGPRECRRQPCRAGMRNS